MKKLYQNSQATKAYHALKKDLSSLPFSFVYNGRVYQGFSPAHCRLQGSTVETEAEKETQCYTFAFADTLEITLVLTHYFSHGVTEWTVWFENISQQNSGLLEQMQTELHFQGVHPMLKGILGDHVNQYSPYSIDLQSNLVEFSSDTGRATHITFPYFNLEYGNGGVMLAIGWAGTWQASFCANGETTTYTASAVNGLRTYLKPGEKIRTALFVMAPYTVRNEHYATNFWRDWFIQHNLPKADATGTALKPFSTSCLAGDTGLPNSDGSISERHTTWRPSLEGMIKQDLKSDFRWFDAGWYVRPDGKSAEPFVKGMDWWESVGTWELDPEKWPGKSFLESTEFARQNGMKTLVWFEPERVTDPENLAKHYGYNTDWAIRMEGAVHVHGEVISNNIGDPACLQWTTDRICKMLRENKVELYREDNNCNAAMLWKHLDEKDGEGRQGITECKFIAAHYKMWDDIIACTLSYGGCGFVDSCASGGGRNDLESMRRGVPLLRSDSDRTTTALRLSMTHGFNKWIPFCGASSKESTRQQEGGRSDGYVWRASYLPCMHFSSKFAQDPEGDFSVLRKGLTEWKKLSPYLLKEFYPLTPWHKEKDNTDFAAFCYYDPEAEEGAILAFRQEACLRERLTVVLPFADKGARFLLTDEDSGAQETTNERIELYFDRPRTARLLWVKKQ